MAHLLSLLFATGATAASSEIRNPTIPRLRFGLVGFRPPTSVYLGGFLFAPADDDPGDFPVVVGNDTRLLASLRQLAVHAEQQLGLQSVLVGVAVFDLLLGVGVKLALEDHHVLGGGEGHFLALLALAALALLAAAALDQCDLVAVNLHDRGGEIIGQHITHGDDRADRRQRELSHGNLPPAAKRLA